MNPSEISSPMAFKMSGLMNAQKQLKINASRIRFARIATHLSLARALVRFIGNMPVTTSSNAMHGDRIDQQVLRPLVGAGAKPQKRKITGDAV
jgi:hypothetical protein